MQLGCVNYTVVMELLFYSQRGGHAPTLPASAPSPIYANMSGYEVQEATSATVVSSVLTCKGNIVML